MPTSKKRLKDLFHFNKQQQRGVFILLLLVLLAFIVDKSMPWLFPSKTYDYSRALSELKEWEAGASVDLEPTQEVKKETSKVVSENPEKEKILKPFTFNPNELSKDQWLSMGLPEHLVQTLLKYRSSGAEFQKPEDLLKVYGMRTSFYKQLKPYVQIPDEEEQEENTDLSEFDREAEMGIYHIKYDINTADSSDLLDVFGVGPFYARQIVKYRDQLGGYVSVNQLLELYNMDQKRLNVWLPNITIQDSLVRKINLNTADFKTVVHHPYLDYVTTKKIFQHRNKLGKFTGLYQLLQDNIISDSLYQRIEPYFFAR